MSLQWLARDPYQIEPDLADAAGRTVLLGGGEGERERGKGV